MFCTLFSIRVNNTHAHVIALNESLSQSHASNRKQRTVSEIKSSPAALPPASRSFVALIRVVRELVLGFNHVNVRKERAELESPMVFQFTTATLRWRPWPRWSRNEAEVVGATPEKRKQSLSICLAQKENEEKNLRGFCLRRWRSRSRAWQRRQNRPSGGGRRRALEVPLVQGCLTRGESNNDVVAGGACDGGRRCHR
ncbi:hypothetical protein DEO72_LG6g1527 [Vigna unguiculata]|uniref:Uncharacterized protein n=1 Tax=Vigna unguiculata TaxID=3917 RepID=A0A4D6M7D0_VIGUN|nr:hypothetical protein DEO72_LG6g1527 [Vigna unguiculata]